MGRTLGYSIMVLISLAIVAGCASRPRINVIRDPGADFSAYSTFGFHEPLGTDREEGTVTVLSGTLKTAARRALESRGYTFEATAPDLLVNFFVETREVIQGRSGPGMVVGYGAYHRHYGVWTTYDTDIRQYRESALHVDVIDVGRNQLVWEGVGTQRLTEHDLTFESASAEESVARIFAGFPRRP